MKPYLHSGSLVKKGLNSRLRACIGRLFALFLMIGSGAAALAQPVFSANNTVGCTPMGVIITVTSPAPGSISSYAWTITRPDGTVQTASSSSYVAIFSMPGSYDVSLTINGNQTTTIQDYITVYPIPQANFSVTDQAGCWPFCVQFSDVSVAGGGDIVEWSWDFGNGATSTQQNPEYCYNQPGTYSPVLSIEDEHGCFSDITIPGLIQVSANFPNAAFSIESTLDCMPPVSELITNTSTGATALTSYWSFGDGQSATIDGTAAVDHTWSAIGTYDVCLTVEDAIGCTDSVCHPFVVFDTAEASFTVSDTQVCENESVAFTSTTVPTPTQWQWDLNGDGTTDATTANPSYTFTQNGTYSPSVTVVYSNTCTDTADDLFDIEVIDGISASFTGDQVLACQVPHTVNFTSSASGPGTLTYSWFIDNQAAGNGPTINHQFDAFGLYDIKLIVTNEYGCSQTVNLNNYVQIAPPTVTFTYPATVCANAGFALSNIGVTGSDPVVSWAWDFNSDGVIDSTDPNPAVSYDTPGQYSISVEIVTEDGCVASYSPSSNIVVQASVDPTFTANTQISCAGEAVEFCVDQQPGVTYSWNFGDGGWQTFNNFDLCVSHDYIDTGYFDVSLAVFNSACYFEVTYEDFIYIAPPLASYDFTIDCANLLTVEFHDTSIGADSLVWDFGDGVVDTSNNPDPIHTYAEPGVYNVLLTAYSDTSNCPDYRENVLYLIPPDPSLLISPNAGCPPLSVDIDNGASNSVWSIEISNGYTINSTWNEMTNQWNTAYYHDGITQNFTYAAAQDFIPNVIFNSAGSYDFTVTVTDQNLCTADTTYPDAVVVSANPDFATFTVEEVELCDSVYLHFIPSLPNLESWTWVFSDGAIVTSEDPYHTFSAPYPYGTGLTATLAAEDSVGCASTVTQEIDVVFPPTPMFAVVNDPSCAGAEVSFINQTQDATAGYTYLWTFGDPASGDLNSSSSVNPMHVYTTNGTYEVCLTATSANGCSVTYCNPEAVHIVDPVASFTYSSTINNCLYGVSFQNTSTGGSNSVSWDFGDDQVGLGASAFHTYPLGVYDVTLVVENDYGCIDTLVVPDILNFGDVIGPFTQVLDTANCTPFTVDFSAYNISDNSFDYFWDFDDGNGEPGGATQTTHDYTMAGSYCPSLIMTDNNGCPVLISCPDTIEVIAFELAFSSIEPICLGDSLHVSISGATTYAWNPDPFLTEVAPGEYELHPAADHAFVVTGYYSDCQTTDTINVVVNNLPDVSINTVEEVCYQDPSFMLDGGYPGGAGGAYFIEGAPTTTFNPSQPPNNSYEVVYEYTDANGCVNSDTTFIFVNPLPNVSLSAFNPVCEDAADVTMSGGNPAGGAYVYMLDTISSFDPSTGFGTYPVTYFFTDVNGCTNHASQNLTVHPLPAPAIAIEDICLNQSLQATNLSTVPQGSIAAATWSFEGLPSQNAVQPIPVSYDVIGTYSVGMTVFTNAGCSASMDTAVNVWAVPQAFFSVDPGCQYDSLLFTDLSVIESGAVTGWTWNSEGNVINGSSQQYYEPQGWGQIPMTLIAISDHGCTDTLTQMTTVFPAPIVNITVNDNCFGEMSEFIGSSSVPLGFIMQEIWASGDGYPDVNGNMVDHYYDHPGQFAAVFTSYSDEGCVTAVTDTIVVHHLPEPAFGVDNLSFCAESPAEFIDASTIASPYEIVSWSWVIGDSLSSAEQHPVTLFTEPGNYDVYLEVTSDAGCSADTLSPLLVTVWPKPDASFAATPSAAYIYEPVISFEDQSSSDVTAWQWEFGDGNTSSDQHPQHEYNDYDQYVVSLVVTNEHGCMDTTLRDVEINPDMLIYIPNAFTPDLDGKNEVFIPVMSGFEIGYYEFFVFNRWGEEVFHTIDPTEGWNGSQKESGLWTPDGVYQWQLRIRPHFDAAIRQFDGHVTVLR